MKRIEKLALGVAALAVVGTVAFAVFMGIANQRLAAARASFQTPEAVNRFQSHSNGIHTGEAAVAEPAERQTADPDWLSGDSVQDFLRLQELLDERYSNPNLEMFNALRRPPDQ